MLKSFIQKIALLIFVVSCFSSSLSALVDYVVENQPVVLEKALKLPQKGILKQKDNGYLYLEVSPEFIASILPLIEAPGKITPPRHFKSKKGIGAHISVMYENEQILNEIWQIDELGQEFTFNVIELRTIKLQKDNRVKKLWLLAISAPELEKLRLSYGLPALLKGHDFHITIGTQTPGAPAQQVDCVAEEPLFIEAA